MRRRDRTAFDMLNCMTSHAPCVWKTIAAAFYGCCWLVAGGQWESRMKQFRERQSGELCDTEAFRVTCADGEVIVMTSARYGRMKLGRCVELELGYLGCWRDVRPIMDRRCSGRRTCEVRVPDAELEATEPCLRELKNYMEASYLCVPVATVTTSYCRLHDDLPVSVTSYGTPSVTGADVGSGFIASIVTTDTPGCDGPTHPWRIEVLPGQRINVTLYDYTSPPLPIPSSRTKPGPTVTGNGHSVQSVMAARQRQHKKPVQQCRQYGLIQEIGTTREVMTSSAPADRLRHVCGGQSRVSHVYLSSSNAIKFWVTAGSDPRDLNRFLIEYSVIGCPNLDLSAEMTYVKSEDGDEMTVTCLHQPLSSNTRWTLTCDADSHKWVGVIGNCTSSSSVRQIERKTMSRHLSLTRYENTSSKHSLASPFEKRIENHYDSADRGSFLIASSDDQLDSIILLSAGTAVALLFTVVSSAIVIVVCNRSRTHRPVEVTFDAKTARLRNTDDVAV